LDIFAGWAKISVPGVSKKHGGYVSLCPTYRLKDLDKKLKNAKYGYESMFKICLL
jgi:hypothetical protein